MLHPTVRLVSWGAGAALVQGLPPQGVLAASFLAGAVALMAAPRRLGQLLRRSRWLLLALLLLFSFATPGVYLLPGLGRVGPTIDGLRLGLEHALRLFFVLASLALLLARTDTVALMTGLYGLIRPLAWLGLDRRRVALRLMLVMHYVEQAPPGRRWRAWLQGEEMAGEPRRLRLEPAPLGWRDFAVLAGLTFAAWALYGVPR